MSLILAAVLVAKLPLVVRIYDAAGVPGRVLTHATQTAGITLASAGLEPIWRPCHAQGCVSKPKPHEVEIRIVKATARSEQGSLGFAAVDVVQRAGTLATVYLDRVDALAVQAGADRGELLGRTIAHEIGHLILGTVDHGRHGLMRATWNASELRRDMPRDWIFSEAESSEMRLRLAARAAGQPAVESVIAQARLSFLPGAFDDPTAIFKRAKRLDAGTRITVTVAGAAPVDRYLVRLDEAELVVLKLDAPGLPKRRLLNLAIDNPAWLAATSKTTYRDNDLRIGPDGLFVRDKKLADLADVVEHIAREKITSIVR